MTGPTYSMYSTPARQGALTVWGIAQLEWGIAMLTTFLHGTAILVLHPGPKPYTLRLKRKRSPKWLEASGRQRTLLSSTKKALNWLKIRHCKNCWRFIMNVNLAPKAEAPMTKSQSLKLRRESLKVRQQRLHIREEKERIRRLKVASEARGNKSR